MAITHKNVTEALKQNTDHFFCISIKDGEIFQDISVEGYTEKIAIIDHIEKWLELLKQS